MAINIIRTVHRVQNTARLNIPDIIKPIYERIFIIIAAEYKDFCVII